MRPHELTVFQLATLARLPSSFKVIGRVAGDPVLRAPRSGLRVLLARNGRLILCPGAPR